MFSKELENLIQATLEDGVLEEYEKAALVKRATAEGVDLTELEIYINSILQKRQRELNEKKNAEYAKAEQQKKEAFGKVCPNCGKQVQSLTLRCECGYEFRNEKAVSSVQKFYDSITNIQLTKEELDECSMSEYGPFGGEKRVVPQLKEKILKKKEFELVSAFPVPNTKEDIIEFLALAAPKSHMKGGFFWGTMLGRIICLTIVILIACVVSAIAVLRLSDPDTMGGNLAGTVCFIVMCGMVFGGFICSGTDKDTLEYNKETKIWKDKFEQVLMKGRSMRGDAEFQQQLDYYEAQLKK